MLVRGTNCPRGDPVYGPWRGCSRMAGGLGHVEYHRPEDQKHAPDQCHVHTTRLFVLWAYTLGVLRYLQMPGELSEGSFHDYIPETRRLLSNHYRKMEAYALRNSFMQYFGVPADSLGIIAGIQREIGSNIPMNYTQVRLLPEDRIFMGDGYKQRVLHVRRCDSSHTHSASRPRDTRWIRRASLSGQGPQCFWTYPSNHLQLRPCFDASRGGRHMYSAAASVEIQFSNQ